MCSLAPEGGGIVTGGLHSPGFDLVGNWKRLIPVQ